LAVKRIIQAALKAVSYNNLDTLKDYKFYKVLINMRNRHNIKPYYKIWDHVVSYQNRNIPVRIYSPKDSNQNKILLYFHGSGWISGDMDSYNNVCANMANMTNSTVVAVDYRYAPQYRFPAAPEDCYRIAREIFNDMSLFNTSSDIITLIGDSAGGNLAAAVSLMARDRKEFLPCNQILIYPSTYNDHTDKSPYASIKDNGKDYLLTSKQICDYMALYAASKEDLNNPYFAPLSSKDFSRQPRTLIITAEHDPLRDEGEDYGKRLKEAGNIVEIHRIKNAMHGFFSLPPVFKQVRECYSIINKFLSEGAENEPSK
jgi:acetyl esterase/lipase